MMDHGLLTLSHGLPQESTEGVPLWTLSDYLAAPDSEEGDSDPECSSSDPETPPPELVHGVGRLRSDSDEMSACATEAAGAQPYRAAGG